MTSATCPSPVNRLFLVGCGVHARKLYHYVAQQGLLFGGFVSELPDDIAPITDAPFLPLAALGSPAIGDAVVVAIGNPDIRHRLSDRCVDAGWPLGRITHPTAYCAPDAKIGEGTVICAGAIVETGARIGRGVIIDIGALVDHDAIVADFSHVRAGQIRLPVSMQSH